MASQTFWVSLPSPLYQPWERACSMQTPACVWHQLCWVSVWRPSASSLPQARRRLQCRRMQSVHHSRRGLIQARPGTETLRVTRCRPASDPIRSARCVLPASECLASGDGLFVVGSALCGGVTGTRTKKAAQTMPNAGLCRWRRVCGGDGGCLLQRLAFLLWKLDLGLDIPAPGSPLLARARRSEPSRRRSP